MPSEALSRLAVKMSKNCTQTIAVAPNSGVRLWSPMLKVHGEGIRRKVAD